MLDTIGPIAGALLGIFGLVCIFAPTVCMQADKRDDPAEVSKVKKFGYALIAFTIAVFLKVLKYKLI